MQIRKLLRRYRGGIDFNHIYHEHYFLGENFKLSLRLPECNPPKPIQDKIINYPFEEEGWFERHFSFIAHLKYIPIHEAYWFYMPLIPTPFRGELGDLLFNISIAKLPSPAKNEEELARVLLDEYNDYYNSPTIGDYALGHNTKILRDIEAHSARRAYPFTEEEKQELLDIRMLKGGYPNITKFDHCTINNIAWIRFFEIRTRLENKKYFYATLLEKGFYLLCEFKLSTNMSDNSKPWYKDADASIIPIMHGISLQHMASIDDQDNLLTAPSVSED